MVNVLAFYSSDQSWNPTEMYNLNLWTIVFNWYIPGFFLILFKKIVDSTRIQTPIVLVEDALADH